MTPSRDISRLQEIMAALRDKETGCPWDIEQDFRSIAPYTIEEAYEVADAIERDDMVDLCDELGDLLLQPIYHAQMAAEAGHFNFGDVVEGATKKMIRRHPHVFGNEKTRAIGMAEGIWERIKAEERAEKAAAKPVSNKDQPKRVLGDIPRAMPALTHANKLAKRAASTGFDWPDTESVRAKVHEEIAELAEVEKGDKARQEEELGDLLFAIANYARHLKIDPEKALALANEKFIRRFAYVEDRCHEENLDINKAGLEKLDGFWNEIRQADKQA